jgi:hypothetical protein
MGAHGRLIASTGLSQVIPGYAGYVVQLGLKIALNIVITPAILSGCGAGLVLPLVVMVNAGRVSSGLVAIQA